MKSLLIALLVAVSASLAAAEGSYPDITREDLAKAIEGKAAVIIDVNGSESYAKAHIPGAIDFASEEAKLAEKLPKQKDALVVAYCGSPKCTAYKKAAAAAVALGYTNVKHYSGGIKGWVEAKMPTEGAAGANGAEQKQN